ncbi:MAG: His-Xaa-Ser system protein HxsD [bacterium]|nr:His-Xaa-Ser system protein HxsD [bacterium]
MNEGNNLIINIDLSIYDKIAALKTCYMFQDRCHTSLEHESDSILKAILIPQKKNIDLLQIERQFRDELIDQQIRIENDKLFSDTRKMIIEQAFKPISYAELKIKIKK